MSAVTQEDWRPRARELREAGLPIEEVADAVERAESTVRKFLKAEGVQPAGEEPDAGPDPDDGPVYEGPDPGPDDSAEWEYEQGGGADPATPEELADVPHPDQDKVPPFRREQARINEAGGVDWESESAYTEHLRVDGTRQIALDLGGKLATSAVLKLSGKAEVDGFYRKGDRVRFSGEALIVSVTAKDKLDKPTGIVMEAEESYAAVIVDLQVGD